MLAAWFFLEALRGNALGLSSSCWYLAVLGIPRLVDASFQPLSPRSQGLLPCASLHLKPPSFFLFKGATHWNWVHPKSNQSHFKIRIITSAKTLFLRKVTVTGTECEDLGTSRGSTSSLWHHKGFSHVAASLCSALPI